MDKKFQNLKIEISKGEIPKIEILKKDQLRHTSFMYSMNREKVTNRSARGPSERTPSGWDTASRSRSQFPQVTDSSQSHDGLLTEP